VAFLCGFCFIQAAAAFLKPRFKSAKKRLTKGLIYIGKVCRKQELGATELEASKSSTRGK
jgi:hypothetical protein